MSMSLQLREAKISAEICKHNVAHIKAAGLNVQDFIPEYQTAMYWSNQYEVLRIEHARFPDLYHGQKEHPHLLLVQSKLKPPMVDVHDMALKHFSKNAHQFEYINKK